MSDDAICHRPDCPLHATMEERVTALERDMTDVVSRLDAHDRRFIRLELTLGRLLDSATAQSLLMQGVDRKLDALVAGAAKRERDDG